MARHRNEPWSRIEVPSVDGAPAEAPRRSSQPTDVSWTGGAARPPTLTQWASLGGLAIALIAGAILAPALMRLLLHDLFFVLFALAAATRLGAALTPRMANRAQALPDHRLPRYTIIAPLYREADVAPHLVAALEELDYPRDRLQIVIVLECDDDETREAFARLNLPPWFQVLSAPPGQPRTKPRACNFALESATGELVTIYDAEDRPGCGQLREAAARFAAGSPALACLQAPLRIEPDRRILPAQFALEYAVLFEVILPALARIGAPFPLGGTSNHFKASALEVVGGWDAWNVTEDADLGFRLAATGYEMGVLATPTYEAAPDRLSIWLPQRSRWVKGYMQTFGVQSRQTSYWVARSLMSFAVTIGAAILAALLHGPMIAWVGVATVLGLAQDGTPWLSAPDALLLVLGWLCAGIAGLVGLRRAGAPIRPRDLLLLPVYWPLHSLAAAHALVQLLTQPFHWDKTPHAPRTGHIAA
jgi:cellulose synthase/poly-beta-1,6-N-acetylglucosamine synthase-like glycosyltransferase